MQYLFFDSKGIDDKVNRTNKNMQNLSADCDDCLNKLGLLNHAMFNNTGYYGKLRYQINLEKDLCSKAKQLMIILDDAGTNYENCEKRLRKSFDDMDKNTVNIENQIRDYFGMDHIKTVDGQRTANICKVVVGTAVIVVGAVVFAPAATVTAICINATVGVAGSALAGTIEGAIEMSEGGDFWDGFSDGYLKESISYTIGTGVEAKVAKLGTASKILYNVGGDITSSAIGTGIDIVDGKNVTFRDIATDVSVAAVGGIAKGMNQGLADDFKFTKRKELFVKTEISLLEFTAENQISSALDDDYSSKEIVSSFFQSKVVSQGENLINGQLNKAVTKKANEDIKKCATYYLRK